MWGAEGEIEAREIEFLSAMQRTTDLIGTSLHVRNVPKAEIAVAAYSIKSLVPQDETARHSGSPALRRPSIYN
jgi:hypothetical protein